ncbi:MAG: NAD(P)-dependent alcohol dehydrogenase [Pseudomonadales bacterium]
MANTRGYAAFSETGELQPYSFNRRALNATDVQIEILYCGVCHSDIHMAKNDWGMSVYPLVPGHEIVGRVKSTGVDVGRFSPGDLVGVGCMVDACRACSACQQNLEQHCEQGMLMTYGSPDPHGTEEITQGGYASQIVVDQDFVLRISEKLEAKAVAPLLCAGITSYSPLKQWQVKSGDRVGVIGLGGLGHMGVKLAVAMGAEVVLITRSAQKGADAQRLGATDLLVSTDCAQMEAQAASFDFLLNTIPVEHDITPYLSLLKLGKTMVVVGAAMTQLNTMPLAFGRKVVAGSLIGGIEETQEMLDFCAAHNIVSDVELIAIQDINDAFERVVRSDVKYRFVIDMQSLSDLETAQT